MRRRDLLLSGSAALAASTQAVAAPASGRERLLRFLRSIRGKHTLSGQVLLPGQDDLARWRAINALGLYPGVFGCNIYGNAHRFNPEYIQAAIGYAQGGRNGLLQAVICLDQATPPDPPGHQAGSWFTPDTAEYSSLQATLRNDASAIASFARAGVPVIYRPWHEMNGRWNWYSPNGGNDGASVAEFIRLWRATHGHMQRAGLGDWIVWCFSPNSGQMPYAKIWPGGRYVDIVGIDVYSNEWGTSDYESAQRLCPLVCFGEFGFGDAQHGNSTMNFAALVKWLKSNAPTILYWMSWDGVWDLSHSVQPHQALYGDPWVLNRGQFAY